MLLNEGSATVLFRFTGLGIVCPNKDKQRAEIAALRDGTHKLIVKLQKLAYLEGSEKDAVVYQDFATYENLPADGVQIDIKAVSNPAIEGFEIYQNGDFDRLGSSDVNDFRWIVNLHELHGGNGTADLTPTMAQPYPLAKIYLKNGLLYAHKVNRDLFFEKVEKDVAGIATQREVFGNVGETVGAKIEGDEVSFTIRIGDREETHSLKRVPGFPYRIEITNIDPSADAIFSDMPDYYQYLSSASGKQVDLNPLVEDEDGEPGGGGSISQKDFCHPIVVEDPVSIDNL